MVKVGWNVFRLLLSSDQLDVLSDPEGPFRLLRALHLTLKVEPIGVAERLEVHSFHMVQVS